LGGDGGGRVGGVGVGEVEEDGEVDEEDADGGEGETEGWDDPVDAGGRGES